MGTPRVVEVRSETVMPDLVGMPHEEAAQKLREEGLDMDWVVDPRTDDLVALQSIRPKKPIARGTLVKIKRLPA